MDIASLAKPFPLSLDLRARTLADEVARLALSDNVTEAVVIVAEGPRTLLDNLLGYAAPYQTTDDAPTPMMAVAFAAGDPEGAYVRQAVEANPKLRVMVQTLPSRDLPIR